MYAVQHLLSLVLQSHLGYISCTDILPHSIMRLMFILTSTAVVILNTSSIFNCILSKEKNKALSVIVMVINMTDILSAMYLCIIWIADLSFQGIFHVKEELWRSSVACFSAFFFLLFFTILSTCVLTFMALSRLMLVWYPVDTKFKDYNFMLNLVLFMVILSLIICLFITIISRIHFMKILPMSLCLPFVDPSNSVLLIKILVWSFIPIQSIFSLIILIIYVLLALSLSKVKNNDIKQKSIHKSYGGLILQLILVTVSNILCWFSTNGIYLTTMILTEYPTQVIIWSTVMLMPINSIVNPTVFCAMSLKIYLRSRYKKLRI